MTLMVPSGIIAVIRAATAQEAETIGLGLAAAGVDGVEITFTVPNAVDVIAILRSATEVPIGAGTVRSVADARAAVAAGATFIVSPDLVTSVVAEAHRLVRALGRIPHVDVFPSAPTGTGNALFMPLFGGAPILDDSLNPADLRLIEPDRPALLSRLVRRTDGARAEQTWPPPYWHRVRHSGSTLARVESNEHMFIGPLGLPNARRGSRNKIAGRVARRFAENGDGIESFKAWDSYNEPPLALDEPKQLVRWWTWAIRKARRE